MVGFTSKSPCPALPKIEEQTVPEFLFRKAKEFHQKGREAFLEDGLTGEKRYSKDLQVQSERIASFLFKRGFRKGDIVLYMTSHQLHQVSMMMGVWRANGIVRSLYVDESEETMLEKLEESKVRWMFCDAENADKCKSIADKAPWSVEVIICGPSSGGNNKNGFENFNEFYKDDGKSCPKFELTGDDVALILPTSGTTGPSKGAMHIHKTVINQIRHWSMFPFTQHKPNIIASKGTHISGAILPLALLAKGVLGIVLAKVNKEILIQTVDKYKPGGVFAFPSFLLALGTVDADGYDISSVETILTGGSPITGEMYKAYMAIPSVKTVIIAFGLTEGPNVSTTTDFRDDRTHGSYVGVPDATVGKPYPGGEIQIRALDTLEVLVGPKQQGEVCCKGDYLFAGYYKNPESTKAAYIDGWFRTGDVGYLDENGYLFIVDRAKDIFKYFNNHISPTDLEGVIGMHPEVKEACVFPIPDEGGDVPRAFVTLKNPNGKKFAELAKEIKTFADGKLATYKQLRGGLYIIDDFPKGKTGKVVRNIVALMPLPIY